MASRRSKVRVRAFGRQTARVERARAERVLRLLSPRETLLLFQATANMFVVGRDRADNCKKPTAAFSKRIDSNEQQKLFTFGERHSVRPYFCLYAVAKRLESYNRRL